VQVLSGKRLMETAAMEKACLWQDLPLSYLCDICPWWNQGWRPPVLEIIGHFPSIFLEEEFELE
jgi:hypothetical protein